MLVGLPLGVDADAFWFNQKADAWKKDPRFAFVSKPEFRQAISYAVDREQFAENVFLGSAVPIWGPVTPGNPSEVEVNLISSVSKNAASAAAAAPLKLL